MTSSESTIKRTSYRSVFGVPDVEVKSFALVRLDYLLEILRVDGLNEQKPQHNE